MSEEQCTIRWAPVRRFDGFYEISSTGEIKRTGCSSGASQGRIKKLSRHACGYLSVTLYRNNKPQGFLVHRLVAEAFIREGWRRGHRPEFYGERNQTTVWELTHETTNLDRLHPTQKPIALFEPPIHNHTKRGEVCYEPFAGSGSQIIACAKHERRCFAMEIEPKWCDVCISRWQGFTGDEARLEDTEESFNSRT